jgi:hypothetical protein
MTKPDEFREFAEEALRWSRQSRTEEAKNWSTLLSLG